jgi:hypothetical protein
VTTQPSLTPAAFAAKWRGVTTTEKASAQEHFIDLCRMLGDPTPHEADPIGAQYAFEKRVSKAGGGEGSDHRRLDARIRDNLGTLRLGEPTGRTW